MLPHCSFAKTPKVDKLANRISHATKMCAMCFENAMRGILCVDTIGSPHRGILCVDKIGSVAPELQE